LLLFEVGCCQCPTVYLSSPLPQVSLEQGLHVGTRMINTKLMFRCKN
jgi:hypothetical protein